MEKSKNGEYPLKTVEKDLLYESLTEEQKIQLKWWAENKNVPNRRHGTIIKIEFIPTVSNRLESVID